MARYKYPYSDFHELNLDYILKLCRESLGIGLKVVGRELYLVNDLEEPISKVTISFAETALTDVDGKPIKSYLISAGVDNKKLVFTNGDREITSITVPYATKAEEDIHGEKIDSYVRNVDVAGDKIRITFGDGHTYIFTVPYAVKASEDVNHKLITTYAAGIRVDGNEIVLTDGTDTEIKRITVHYAETASADDEGAEIKKTYAHSITTGQTTVKLIAKDGTQLSEITVPYAVSALKDVEGQDFLSAYAQHLIVDGQRIAVEAHDGTRLSTITVPFATLATDATNAIESVRIVGDQLVATTYGGVNTELTIPYALRAKNDNMGNEITKSYVASVTNNPTTGEITFFDKEGNVIAVLVPSVKTAENDTYGNLIADFVKTVTVTDDSNYVTVTHGTGLVDTLLINYATHAFKDANENIIHNTYVAFLTVVHDDETGEPWLVAYNGERSEIFRLQIEAVSAMKDALGNIIHETYGVELAFEDERLTLINAAGESLGHVTIKQNFGKSLNVTDENMLQLLNDEGDVLSEVELPGSSAEYRFYSSQGDTYTNIDVFKNVTDPVTQKNYNLCTFMSAPFIVNFDDLWHYYDRDSMLQIFLSLPVTFTAPSGDTKWSKGQMYIAELPATHIVHSNNSIEGIGNISSGFDDWVLAHLYTVYSNNCTFSIEHAIFNSYDFSGKAAISLIVDGENDDDYYNIFEYNKVALTMLEDYNIYDEPGRTISVTMSLNIIVNIGKNYQDTLSMNAYPMFLNMSNRVQTLVANFATPTKNTINYQWYEATPVTSAVGSQGSVSWTLTPIAGATSRTLTIEEYDPEYADHYYVCGATFRDFTAANKDYIVLSSKIKSYRIP